METFEGEIWKDVVGFEGVYLVSNKGRARRVNPRKGREILKPYISKWGYAEIGLSDGPRQKLVRIHRLVADAFLPNPENKPQVNHINGIKTDNTVENLEWVTLGENNTHAAKMGLQRGTFGKGEDHFKATLTAAQVIEMRQRFKEGNYQIKEFAKIYGLRTHHMGDIVRGRSWKNLPL